MFKRAVHPGEILKEEVQELGVSPTEFARQVDVRPTARRSRTCPQRHAPNSQPAPGRSDLRVCCPGTPPGYRRRGVKWPLTCGDSELFESRYDYRYAMAPGNVWCMADHVDSHFPTRKPDQAVAPATDGGGHRRSACLGRLSTNSLTPTVVSADKLTARAHGTPPPPATRHQPSGRSSPAPKIHPADTYPRHQCLRAEQCLRPKSYAFGASK